MKYEGVERPNLPGLSCRLRFDCGIAFPTLCLTPERWIGTRVQSTVGCFSEWCFLQFPVAQVLVGFQKQFINCFIFPTWACAAGFNNNSLLLLLLLKKFSSARLGETPYQSEDPSPGKIGLTTMAVTHDLLSGMPLVLLKELIRLWNSILPEPGQPSAQLSKLIRLTTCKKTKHTVSRWYRTVYIP